MLDSLRSRWLLAIGGAIAVALLITLAFSGFNKRAEQKGVDALATWKARSGVDLTALPRLRPPHPDSPDARGLDTILRPMQLHLGGLAPLSRVPESGRRDSQELDELRDYLRAAIRAETTEPRALTPSLVVLIERHARTLDAVADYVAAHPNIRWREDLGPRRRSSGLYTADHITLHRLLIGRAFLALERGDVELAGRMLATSQRLNRPIIERWELDSQFIAVGVERLQLALMRRAGTELNVAPLAPTEGIAERYVDGMSGEAALVLANANRPAFGEGEDGDLPENLVRLLAAPKVALAAEIAVTKAAERFDEIRRTHDGCAELAKRWSAPGDFFGGNFYTLNPVEAWHRFVILELDRAMTAAVLTGRAASPCPSVVITVRDEGATRTVEAKGLPEESESVIGVPKVIRRPFRAAP
jgi:hypothetical protein